MNVILACVLFVIIGLVGILERFGAGEIEAFKFSALQTVIKAARKKGGFRNGMV
jgi:hypothetical protein